MHIIATLQHSAHKNLAKCKTNILTSPSNASASR